ncbi:phage protein, HK97 GP10 family [Salipiger abyssi]|uniref:Phage protein, HK97 GP10 family n=2 Tax=Salipiger abyssi TaxID=1250539 RepID=A0A1P8UUS8_9RHOB|nr:phage protein, HK97 GP10 family [Salipiger abyssi]
MRAIPLRVRLEVIKQLEKEADKVVKLMRAMAPKDTGAGAESIGWTWGDAPKGAITVGKVADNEYDRIAIKIYAGGGDQFYMKFQEFGTKRQKKNSLKSQEFGTVDMPANPFFFPVWRAEKRRVKANLRSAVRRGIKKAQTKG